MVSDDADQMELPSTVVKRVSTLLPSKSGQSKTSQYGFRCFSRLLALE